MRVVIVGAGVIGSFCAVRLAKAGARVTLLECEPGNFSVRGPAASLAAAGMLSPIGEGGVGHPQFDKLALDSFDLWRAQREGAFWADGVAFDGAVIQAADEAGVEALVGRAHALGRTAVPLTSAQFRKRTHLHGGVAHAVFVEDEGVATPSRVLSGLAFEAQRFGVLVHYGCDVERVETNPLGARMFDGRFFEADHVVLATGHMCVDDFAPVAPALKHVRPAKGHMVPVELAAPLAATVRARGFYLARRGEEHVLGATMEWDRYDRRVDQERVRELLAAAEAAFPGAVRPHHDEPPWAGVRPMSPDGAPMIGRSGDVLIAAGHGRHGWLLAPVTAEIIAAHVLGAPISPLWAAFAPDRFDPKDEA